MEITMSKTLLDLWTAFNTSCQLKAVLKFYINVQSLRKKEREFHRFQPMIALSFNVWRLVFGGEKSVLSPFS